MHRSSIGSFEPTLTPLAISTVPAIGARPAIGAIIAAIVALANALNMQTTAEGIETLDQLDLIRSLGVSHIQGYVYSRPVDNESLLERCAAGEWIIMPAGPAVQRSDRFSMYRKIGAVHDDHCYEVVLRNLSVSGALIEGIYDVPVGTKFVLDLGDGQLVIATTVRSAACQQGVMFEERLVSDGDHGLCTNRRASPYMLAAVGLTAASSAQGSYSVVDSDKHPAGIPAFSTMGNLKVV
jgi:hypothetical protein